MIVAITISLIALILALLWGREWRIRRLLASEERDAYRDENERLRRIVVSHEQWLVWTACLPTAERDGLCDDTLMRAFENLYVSAQDNGFPEGVEVES